MYVFLKKGELYHGVNLSKIDEVMIEEKGKEAELFIFLDPVETEDRKCYTATISWHDAKKLMDKLGLTITNKEV